MIQVDSIDTFAMSVDDIVSVDSGRVSDAHMFKEFAKGIHLTDDFLVNDRWAQGTHFTSVDTVPFVMHEMLPTVYDVDHLEAMGGTIAIRVTGCGDFTMVAINQRVVTMSGLPEDLGTSEEVLDFEISQDIFLGYCRGLLLETADEILEADNEFEDRPVGHAELMLNGMPAGGFRANEGANDYADNFDQIAFENIGAFDELGLTTGNIHDGGDNDMIAVYLDASKPYIFSLYGDLTNRGTLRDPRIYGLYDSDGTKVHSGNDDINYSAGVLDSRIEYTPSETGIYYLQVGSFSTHTGSYTAEVYTSNTQDGGNSFSAVPRVVDGLFDFADEVSDISVNNIGTVNEHGRAVAVFEHVGDNDIFEVSLVSGQTYNFAVETGHNNAEGPNVAAIYDAEGNWVSGTSIASGNWLGNHVATFSPTETGIYYVKTNSGTYYSGSYTLEVDNADPNATGSDSSISSCGAALFGCGAAEGLNGVAFCGADLAGCGGHASISGAVACGGNVFACGGNTSVTGAFVCTANVSGCGGNASITGVFGCGGNASACGGNAYITGAGGCGANSSGCGAAAGICGAAGCGANASVCGAQAGLFPVSGCGANASACAADLAIPCFSYAVACLVDLGGAVDVGACLVNVVPVLPSC